jgi:hypothetical protein
MAKFSEVFRCSGVDESPNVPGKSKVPGMIVSPKGWNLVALEDGPRLRVHCDNKNIRIEELRERCCETQGRAIGGMLWLVKRANSECQSAPELWRPV